VTAHQVRLDGDPRTECRSVHALTPGDHLPTDLVADHARRVNARRGPRVPVVEMDVGAAHRGRRNPQQDLAGCGARNGHVADRETGSGCGFEDGEHGAVIMRSFPVRQTSVPGPPCPGRLRRIAVPDAAQRQARRNMRMLDGVDRPAPGPRPRRIPVEDLSVYEGRGGHTLRRHVDTRPGDEMRRILREGVAAAGRFVSRATAQRCVDVAVTRRSAEIAAWLAGRDKRAPFTFVEDMGEIVGHVLTYAEVSRGIAVPRQVTAVRLVLRRCVELPGGFTVVTAYPTRSPFRDKRH
jgi:hypothetical protein